MGHAVWIRENCIVLRDDQNCDNCAPLSRGGHYHGASMRGQPPFAQDPAVNRALHRLRACENLRPSRPFSAIYVEGRESSNDFNEVK